MKSKYTVIRDRHGARIVPAGYRKERNPPGSLLALVMLLGVMCIAAVTQIDLTTQVKGILPFGNGGTGVSSIAAGLLRSSGSALTSAELSGDATTSASNVVTVAQVNGTAVPVNAAADQVIVTTASQTGAWKTITGTEAGGLAVTYNATTHAFGTIAVLAGTMVDNETPTGTINGTNPDFTLATAPSPAASLMLYKNGQLMIAGGADYTLVTLTVTYAAGAIPLTGDVHRASYRY